MNDEIALFIDFENIRYSLLNVRHREPDPQELIGVARRYGTVMVARAYADWNRQPDFFKGSLTAAMIDRVDCPSKFRGQRPNGSNNPYASYTAYSPATAPRQYDQEQDDEELMEDGPSDELDETRPEAQNHLSGEDATQNQVDDEEDLDEDYDDDEAGDDQAPSYESANHRPYAGGGAPYHGGAPVTTQSTVDLNMLMDIIETVFDRPTINTYVLMTGDRDFTRICARLKLRLNKHVIVVGVPGTVSRDLISAAGGQFIPLGGGAAFGRPGLPRPDYLAQGPVEPEEPGFIQFLDYIDSHWAWRTIGGVANFIGDPFNPKNRFRGRLTRETARDLLHACIDRSILIVTTDQVGGDSLQLNRAHPAVQAVLNESQA